MLNKKHPQPNTLSQWRTGRGRRLYFSAVLMLARCAALACPALAADTDPLTIVNNLSDFIFSCIKAVGVIVLGCVIQGETRHFDYVCQGVTQGVTQLMLSWNMPVAFGVLTTENLQQAIDRAGGKYGNKGDEAAAAVIKMIALQIEMEPEETEADRKKIN